MRKSKVFNFLCILSVFLFIALFSKPGVAQVEGDDVVIGQSLTMTSKIFKRDVRVLISVPEGYNAGSTNYPVLYDLGSFNFTYDSGTVEFLVG